MTKSVDPDQTAPGSTLFASILQFVSNVRQLFAADNFSRRHFQVDFFLGTLRAKENRCVCVFFNLVNYFIFYSLSNMLTISE